MSFSDEFSTALTEQLAETQEQLAALQLSARPTNDRVWDLTLKNQATGDTIKSEVTFDTFPDHDQWVKRNRREPSVDVNLNYDQEAFKSVRGTGETGIPDFARQTEDKPSVGIWPDILVTTEGEGSAKRTNFKPVVFFKEEDYQGGSSGKGMKAHQVISSTALRASLEKLTEKYDCAELYQATLKSVRMQSQGSGISDEDMARTCQSRLWADYVDDVFGQAKLEGSKLGFTVHRMNIYEAAQEKKRTTVKWFDPHGRVVPPSSSQSEHYFFLGEED